MKRKLKPAVFLDRDGTIINERGYLSDPMNMVFYPSAFPALRRLQKSGYRLIVITNQSGVGRGYFSLKTLSRINDFFLRKLKKKGITVSGIYFCPHRPNAGCRCRKPKPFLVYKAAREHAIDIPASYVIGDQWRDTELGLRSGATPVLVLTGAGRSNAVAARKSKVEIKKNLLSAARWVSANGRRR